jgi:hypothetical protein
MSDRLKFGISYAVNVGLLLAALFVEEIRRLPLVLVLILVVIFAAVQSLAGSTFDYLRQKALNARLRRQTHQLRLNEAQTRRQLTDLQKVVVSFLEYSDIYRDRVKDHLKLTQDYLCIVKSSEGFSAVFNAMERKRMLPFGSLLMRISGVVRPFENIGLFLIPVTSLPGLTEYNTREYIATQILPEVEKEREAFLASLPRKVAAKADPLSYKYIAFLLRKGAIAHGLLNRKFNREFNAFIVDQQSSGDFSTMKEELGKLVRTKDLLALVNWASFAQLNEEQRSLVEKHKDKMSARLRDAGLDTLAALASTDADRFFEVVWPALVRRTTKKKALNISKKIIDGAHGTVQVLRNNGIILQP